MAVLAAQPLAYVVFSPLAGLLLDGEGGSNGSGPRLGPRSSVIVLKLGVAAVGLGSACLGTSRWWPCLLAARLLQGAGGAAAEVVAMVWVAEAVPKERLASAEGILEAATGLGYACGLPVAGMLYGSRRGGNAFAPFCAGAVVCAAALLCSEAASLFARRRCSDIHEDGGQSEGGERATQISASEVLRRTASVSSTIFVYGALMGNVYASLALYNQHVHELGAAQSGALLMLIAVAYIILCPIVGGLCDGPVLRSKLCLVSGLLLALLAYSLLAAGALLCQGVGLLVLGASEALVLIPAWPVLLDLAGGEETEASGTVSAILNTSYLAGEGMGPFLSLLLVNHLGFQVAMIVQVFIIGLAYLAVADLTSERACAQKAEPVASGRYVRMP
mmetsp:Transcript_52429/g.169029  ORF Transcript_52429/g.169029 Transcript_52429/m.169029 type:complete len:389 (+) Transcript_52429:242-1408(+)